MDNIFAVYSISTRRESSIKSRQKWRDATKRWRYISTTKQISPPKDSKYTLKLARVKMVEIFSVRLTRMH
jgi:hypothetical protein